MDKQSQKETLDLSNENLTDDEFNEAWRQAERRLHEAWRQAERQHRLNVLGEIAQTTFKSIDWKSFFEKCDTNKDFLDSFIWGEEEDERNV